MIEFAIQLGGSQVRQDRSGIDSLVEEACLAESVGFGTAFVADHYIFERIGVLQTDQPAYELFFVLATLAQRTRKIRLGSQVACMLLRHPAMTARLFAQVDEASEGRVIAGVGAGWTRAEFEMFGLPFPDVSERLAMMDEAVELMRALWGERPVTFEGKYFRTKNAVMLPRPVQKPGPPIMLGGSGKGILRRAGRWADILHMAPAIGREGTTTLSTVAAFTDESVTEKLALVREECVRAGRTPDAVRYATTIYNYSPTNSPQETKEVAAGIGGVFGLSPDAFLRHPVVLAGTPEEMAEEINRRVERHGLAMMGLNFASHEQIRHFGENVLQKVLR